MSEKIHLGARTTPLIRKEIQESNLSAYALAKKYKLTQDTVRKWKRRSHTQNLKPGPKPHNKKITLEQQAAAVAFRIHTRLSIDDCYYSLKKSIPQLSRTALYRCYKRHGVSKLDEPKKSPRAKKTFKKYPPGYIHLDITTLHTQEGRLYLFVAIDRTTKFCFARLYQNQTALTAVNFLKELQRSFPNQVHIILTDNGLQFTTHQGNKENHIFEKTCKEMNIAHRLTKPFHPWTNGQVERTNRLIKEATIKKFYYKDHYTLKNHLQVFITAYNFTKQLKALDGATPYEKTCLYLQSEEGKSYLNPNYVFADYNTYH